ncbi:uncharacterized protein LOC122255971 [Penaeus japonicus]|uniref:uncharacterized protein LOC122255971 n=1 Tax=Penaeus japonicus TaxID=27405 RepID=UPI001C711D01|nr:uncharacterized protein LOC122255971 [Penaeus japonicus]
MGGLRVSGRRASWAASTRAMLLLAVVLLRAASAAAEWDSHCPAGCKCTYVSNRKVADCRNAGFSTVPTSLSSEIQELNLNTNNIMYLEKDAFKKSGLVNLQKLYLKENNIRTVHKDAFRDLRIMIELDLSANAIDKLHPHTFTGLEKLRVLDLSENALVRLDGVQFPPLPHLRKLDFRNNDLVYIHNYAFSNLAMLMSLRLSGNSLKLVQPELFINNTNLVELELHDNPWECDCRLKSLVRWTKKKSLLQEHVTCHSPERVSGRRWEAVSEDELACRPELIVTQAEVPAAPGQNASLTCRASGEPLPQLKWVLHGRVLTNMSVIPFSQPEQRYVVREVVEAATRWSQLTVTHVQDHDLTYYTCVADNLAGLVEHNVSLVAAAPSHTGAVAPKATLDLYAIIGIATGGLVLLLALIVALCCCVRRRRSREMKARPKVNGSAGGHVEHKNVMIVNPVEKPPRQYEQVPQTDIEMAALAADAGAHRSYDEVDYPEAGPAAHRTPLATLEEEDDDLPSQDTTLPLDASCAAPPHSVVDYLGHYPDLLDMTRPRAVSPTQLSYHSLVAPQFAAVPPPAAEYRYSYVHPAEYTPYPVAYVAPQPQPQPRPGYVTLPRRHRSPSWAGQSSLEADASSPPPPQEGERRYDPIYDTLGPRTTADGTSRTDLTRPALRAAEPFTPRTPQSPASPPGLPVYYAPATGGPARPLHHQRNHSSTLPRSTPNLLEGGAGLTLPPHQQALAEGVPAQLVTRGALLPAHSPTPSTASTARTASPAYRAASPAIASPLHLPPASSSPASAAAAAAAPSRSPLASSSESTLDSSALYNNNNNSHSINNNTPGKAAKELDVSVASTGSTASKKVPPKPPPKPSAKRLSVASTASDSRKATLAGDGRTFQDEGPDGTEV